jgi:hypothetical protein
MRCSETIHESKKLCLAIYIRIFPQGNIYDGVPQCIQFLSLMCPKDRLRRLSECGVKNLIFG